MKRHIYGNSLYQFCFYFLLGVTIKKMVLKVLDFIKNRPTSQLKNGQGTQIMRLMGKKS